MKGKIWVLICLFTMCIAIIYACSKNEVSNKTDVTTSVQKEESKYRIVCTVFPTYDWVREIIAEKENEFEIDYLLSSGVDLHNYTPSAEDIAKIKTSNLFIYVGGESEEWVKDLLKEEKLNTISLMEVLKDRLRLEEEPEFEEEEDAHSHEEDAHSHDEDAHSHDEDGEYDEHVWLSIRNASLVVEKIVESLQELDSENTDFYAKKGSEYLKKLGELDSKYIKIIKKAKKDTIVVGDRFPLVYLLEDYSIKHYAAFSGCSAETEASFDIISFLSKKLDELGLNSICVIENSNKKIAETIVENSDNKERKLVTINSMQSVSENEIKEGITYIGCMKENLEALKELLK